PRLITRTHATVITAGCPKPANASAAGTRPKITQASRDASATMSCRQRPHRKSAIVATRIEMMIVCWCVIEAEGSIAWRPNRRPRRAQERNASWERDSDVRPCRVVPGLAAPCALRAYQQLVQHL